MHEDEDVRRRIQISLCSVHGLVGPVGELIVVVDDVAQVDHDLVSLVPRRVKGRLWIVDDVHRRPELRQRLRDPARVLGLGAGHDEQTRVICESRLLHVVEGRRPRHDAGAAGGGTCRL